jgi:hypothetical protein
MPKPRSKATKKKALLFLEDDSESDQELNALLNTTVFGQSQSQSSTASSSGGSCVCSKHNQEQVTPPALPPLSPTTIEQKARHLVASLPLSAVDSCTSLQDLAWHVTKNSVLLCRRNCSLDEAMGLKLPKSRDGPHYRLVLYLGFKHGHAGCYDRAHVKHLFPIDESTTSDYVSTFLKKTCNTKEFRGNQMAKKTEELVALAMIQKVRLKQSNTTTNDKNEDHDHNNYDHNNYDNKPAEKDTSAKQVPAQPATVPVETTATATVPVETTATVPVEIPATAAGAVETPATATVATTAKYENDKDDSSKNDDESSSDDDDDDAMEQDLLLSPTQRSHNKEPLRDGDVICYDPPVGVAGRKEFLMQATILGIHAQNRTFPLILNNGENLPRDHAVKRLRKRYRGTLVQNQKATFKAISKYKLATCGTTNALAGIQRQAARMAHILNRNNDEIKDFVRTFHVPLADTTATTAATTITPGENEPPKTISSTPDLEEDNNNNDGGDDEPTMATGKKRRAQESTASNKRRKTVQQDQDDDADDGDDHAKDHAKAKAKEEEKAKKENPASIEYLKYLLQKAEQEAQKKRRRSVSPHAMTLEQLKIALQVWSRLQQQQQQQHGKDTIEDLLDDVCKAHDMDFDSAKSFLEGDKNNLIRAPAKMEIEKALTQWVQARQPRPQAEETIINIPIALTPELGNDDKEHEPPNTIGKKRPAKESTAAATTTSQSNMRQEAREEPAQTTTSTPELENNNDGDNSYDEPSKKDEAEETKTTGKQSAKESTATSQSNKRRKTCSQEENDDKRKKDTTVEDHPVIGYLKQLLQKAHVSPHAMSLEQIQLALKVWPLLQQEKKRMGKDIENILDQICTTHDFDFDSAKYFLEGDKNNLVPAPTKMEIEEALTQWVQEQQGGEADT